MIKHLVFWKMKVEADGRSGAENAKMLAEKLNNLKSILPAGASLEAGVNFNETAAAWDIGLYTSFANKADLDAYQKHPEHQKIIRWVPLVIESRSVVDFEI